MKTDRNILIAFILNLAFSVFEMLGGMLTGSVAIFSDAIHDLGDAASIGLAYFLERKSRRPQDEQYTYGYLRYSVIGSVITTLVLTAGSAAVIFGAVGRLFNPTAIHYNGMIVLAVIGAAVNLCAALVTRRGSSLNQKAVNLHMLEDVLGWLVVLIGAVVMRFTNFSRLDPLMSIGVAVYILFNALGNLKATLDIFLEKAPHGIRPAELRSHLCALPGVVDVHHMHLWSIDGQNNYATMHIVTDADPAAVKPAVRSELAEHGIAHATLELEAVGEPCAEYNCRPAICDDGHGHHHHHH